MQLCDHILLTMFSSVSTQQQAKDVKEPPGKAKPGQPGSTPRKRLSKSSKVGGEGKTRKQELRHGIPAVSHKFGSGAGGKGEKPKVLATHELSVVRSSSFSMAGEWWGSFWRFCIYLMILKSVLLCCGLCCVFVLFCFVLLCCVIGLELRICTLKLLTLILYCVFMVYCAVLCFCFVVLCCDVIGLELRNICTLKLVTLILYCVLYGFLCCVFVL